MYVALVRAKLKLSTKHKRFRSIINYNYNIIENVYTQKEWRKQAKIKFAIIIHKNNYGEMSKYMYINYIQIQQISQQQIRTYSQYTTNSVECMHLTQSHYIFTKKQINSNYWKSVMQLSN